MNNIKDFFKDKKNILIVVFGVVVLILAIVVIVKVVTRDNTEATLENSLMEMGKDFYENYYYEKTGKTDEERKTFLEKYTTQGIKIDLENLGRYNSSSNKVKIEEFKNPTTGKACDEKNTKAIIYPKANFGKNDYDIEVVLDCGFDNQNENE